MMPTDQPSASSQIVRVGLPSTFMAHSHSALCRNAESRLSRRLSLAGAGPIIAMSDFDEGAGACHGRSTTRSNTTTARGCRSIREIFARWARDGAAYRDEAGEGRPRRDRPELRRHRRARPSTCSSRRGGARRPARAVHPWRLLALARAVELQPDGARHERARRHGRGVGLRSRPAGVDRRRSSSRRSAPACSCGSASASASWSSGHSAGGHLAACMVATDWKKLDAERAGRSGAGRLCDLRPVRSRAAAASRHQRRLQARRRRGAAHLAAVLAGRARPRARRRGRRRGIARSSCGRAGSSPTAGARRASRRATRRCPA